MAIKNIAVRMLVAVGAAGGCLILFFLFVGVLMMVWEGNPPPWFTQAAMFAMIAVPMIVALLTFWLATPRSAARYGPADGAASPAPPAESLATPDPAQPHPLARPATRQGFQIVFQLNEDDFMASIDHWRRTASTHRQSRAFLGALAFVAVVAVIGAELATEKPVSHHVIAVVMKCFLFAVGVGGVAWFSRWLERRGLRQMYSDSSNRTNLEPQTLVIDEQGVSTASLHKARRLSWDAVVDVKNEEDYLFLIHGAGDAIIVPKRAFRHVVDVTSFLALIEQYREKGGDSAGSIRSVP